MSMTLWVHVLEGRRLTSYNDDHTLMNRFLPELDSLCQSLNVSPLSSFLDYTDLDANISEDKKYDSSEINPETGWSYGIDDMTWFSIENGLTTLTALRSHLTPDIAPSIPTNAIAHLIAELDSCISKLEVISPGVKFHLAVIM